MKLSVAEAASILENVRVARRSPASLAAHPHETARARQVDEQRSLSNEAVDPHAGMRMLAGSIAALAAAQAPAAPAPAAPPPAPRPTPLPLAARRGPSSESLDEFLAKGRAREAHAKKLAAQRRADRLAAYATNSAQMISPTESHDMNTATALQVLARETERLAAKRAARQPSARQLACAELDRKMGLSKPVDDFAWNGNRFEMPVGGLR